MTKHKHYEALIAWANGAEIEFNDADNNGWVTVVNPSWDNNFEYRIKPKAKQLTPCYLWATNGGVITNDLRSEKSMKGNSYFTIKLLWSKTMLDLGMKNEATKTE